MPVIAGICMYTEDFTAVI